MAPTSSFAVDPTTAAAVVDTMSDAVLLIGPDGSIEAANQACEAVFGHAPSRLVGRLVEELVPDTARDRHVGHRARYRDDPTSRPMGVGLTLQGRRRDGSTLPIEVSLTPYDGSGRVLAVARDVSAHAALRAESELVQRLLDATSEGVFMFHPQTFELSYVNDGAARQTGYSRLQLLSGMTPLDIVDTHDHDRFRAVTARITSGEMDVIEFETSHRRQDGETMPVDVMLQWPAIEDHGDERPLVALVRDASERRAAEAERNRRQQWLESLSDTRLALLTGVPAEEVLGLVCEHARRLTGGSTAVFLEPDSDLTDAQYVVSAASGAPTGRRLPAIDADGAIAGAITEDGNATKLVATDLAGADADLADKLGACELLVARLRLGSQLDSVLLVGRSDNDGHWSATDQDVIASYALEAATALEVARSRADHQRLLMLEDRERIAADLHDMVIQRLFAAGMRLQGSTPLVTDPVAAARLHEVVDDLDATIRDIRQTIFDLQQPTTGRPPLERTVRGMVQANSSYLGFTPEVRIDGDLDVAPAQAADQLIPVITEALSNVARHAKATAVVIDITAGPSGIDLTVEDDGVGIPATPRPGSGLDNLRRRAQGLGGHFSAVPNPSGSGTTLRWSVHTS